MKKIKIKIEKKKTRIPVPQKPPKVEDKRKYKRSIVKKENISKLNEIDKNNN